MPALAHVMVARAGAAAMAQPAITLESIIGSPKNYADLADLPLPDVAIAPDDAATIFYTSGTTGKPKGALGSHRNLLTNGFSSAYSGAATVLRRGEPLPEPSIRASLLVIPMFHVTACSASMIPTIQAGHKIVLLHKWDTVKAFEIIEREKINATGGVPFIAWQLIEHPDRAKYDLSSIDAISYGGAPSAPELVSKIYEIFGAFPGNGWGSCGPAVAVSDVKIMSEDGSTELPVGEVGELWARGPQIVKGYWNRPDATAETFVDGWVRTGDLARVDDEGFCFIVDRAKDMIIRGGENIYSSEVENILYEHPAVTDAALWSIWHPA
jgi:acyl-CoA synthetase (AMP-forming)/AMP-acid ligase II